MSTLLNLAIDSNLPIVSIRHTDLLHVGTVLAHVLDKLVGVYPLGNEFDPTKATLAKGKLNSFDIFYTANPDFKPTEQIYNWLVNNEKSLILVNHPDTIYSFDAGTLAVPDGLIQEVLKDTIDAKTIESLLPSLQGLTLKSVTELIRITSAKEGSISPKSINANRHLVALQVQGLARVNKSLPLYFPNESLKSYIELNRIYFLSEETPNQLIPRGILLDGIAGTGKTSAAKFISNEFDTPLYRLDVGASLSRFVGDSERNLAMALSAIQQEPYAVLLIDEVEKLFGESDDSGVTTRLLAQLLWFLQEHKRRIFTVMTTNDKEKLPVELYRSGRIDEVFTLTTMNPSEAVKLAIAVAEQFLKLKESQKAVLMEAVQSLQDNSVKFTPATITNTTYSIIKKKGWLLKVS